MSKLILLEEYVKISYVKILNGLLSDGREGLINAVRDTILQTIDREKDDTVSKIVQVDLNETKKIPEVIRINVEEDYVESVAERKAREYLNKLPNKKKKLKLECIKEIRVITGCGLKEAKDLYEKILGVYPL